MKLDLTIEVYSTKSAQDPIHLTQHIITLHNKPLIDMVDQHTYMYI